MSIKLMDFKDLQDAILEELKIQSSDTVSLARVKRVINEVYINEVVPYARWKWLEGTTKIKFREAYSAGTVSVTPNTTTVTLSTAPSSTYGSFAGYYFSVSGHNEVYVISTHTAEGTAIVLTSQFLGSVDADATYKIWTDKVALPTDCRETVTVWHNQATRAMDAMGWQKFRELTIRSPKAEGYPRVYYTGDFTDPSTGTDEYESDRYRELRVHPAIYSSAVTISVDYIKEVVALSADGDEPVLPIEDRIVLKYGALATLWRTIGRNPEEAGFSMQEFQNKLQRMAGKVEDSHDKPQIVPDSFYMRRRRAPRYRVGGYTSDMVGSGGGGNSSSTQFLQDVIIQGARLSAAMTVDSGITIDGVDLSAFYVEFTDHLADTTGAHAASAISFSAVGTIAATDAQTAIAEVATDAATALSDHTGDTTGAHAASAISNTPSGNLAATDQQSVNNELQSDIDTRATAASPTFSGTITTPLTASRAMVTGASSELAVSATTATELGYVSGVTSAIQTQINAKAPSASPTFTGTVTTPVTASRALVTGASSEIAAATTTATEIGYVNGVTSAIQTQLDAKIPKSLTTTTGDIIYASGASTPARLGIGSTNQVLKVISGVPAWAAAASGGINYLSSNPDAEVDTTGWALYEDAAGTQPVNGTGVATSNEITWTRTTSSPLRGTASFLLTKDAADRQGEGVSYDFTIDTADQAKVLQVEFDYSVASGTFTAGSTSADSEVTVWLYDVTNSVLIQPSTYKLYSSSSIADKFIGNFQTASNSTSYRLILHIGVTTAVAYTLKFDNFKVGPCSYVYGTPITDWKSFTPTGSFTNATYTGFYRQVGDMEEYDIKMLMTGTPASATLTINTRSGVTIDTAKLTYATADRSILGTASILDSGTANYVGFAAYNNTTSVLIQPWTLDALSTNHVRQVGAATQAVPMTWAINDTMHLKYSIPVVGRSSSVQQSDSYDGRLIAARYTTSSQAMGNGTIDTVILTTKDYDTTNSYSTSTGLWTCPRSGWYQITGASLVAARSSNTWDWTNYIYVDSTVKKLGTAFSQFGTGIHQFSSPVSDVLYVTAGQTVSLRARAGYSGASLNGVATENTLSIVGVNAPTTISATERISFSATSSTTAATTSAPFIYPTVVENSHGAYSTTTGKFTAPVAGKYFFSGSAHNGGAFAIVVYKNSTGVKQGQQGTATSVATVTHTVYLLAGETVELRPDANVTANGSATLNTFDGFLIK